MCDAQNTLVQAVHDLESDAALHEAAEGALVRLYLLLLRLVLIRSSSGAEEFHPSTPACSAAETCLIDVVDDGCATHSPLPTPGSAPPLLWLLDHNDQRCEKPVVPPISQHGPGRVDPCTGASAGAPAGRSLAQWRRCGRPDKGKARRIPARHPSPAGHPAPVLAQAQDHSDGYRRDTGRRPRLPVARGGRPPGVGVDGRLPVSLRRLRADESLEWHCCS